MSDTPETLFALVEADHLTRIHLKLSLEDVGFGVTEQDDTIALVGTPDPVIAARSPILPLPPAPDAPAPQPIVAPPGS